ncbi:hypothetical protein A3718_06655 [Erythrobacter sp. HI0019]|nr:hypothetical protein A3718_06655 [Erythrobacter sp. HI0019]KZY09077.1 hypothetical protein A3723_11115 [Erythrobacter sp. HI0028]
MSLQARTYFTAPIWRKIGRVQEDRASGCVAAEEDALRPPEDLRRLQVEGVEHQAVVDADVDPVDEDTDRRIDGRDGRVDPQPTDGKVGCAFRSTDVL